MTKIFTPGDLIMIKESLFPASFYGPNTQNNIVMIIALQDIIEQVSSYGFHEYYESYTALHEYRGLIELKMLTLNKTKNCGLIVIDPADKNYKHGRHGNFVIKLSQ